METRTYYDILEVANDATSEVIKKNYHRLALAYHPDKQKSRLHKAVTSGSLSIETAEKEYLAAEERFKELASAYETLSDDTKRNEYDEFLKNPNSYGVFDGNSQASMRQDPRAEAERERREAQDNAIRQAILENKPNDLLVLWRKSDKSPYRLVQILECLLSPDINHGDNFATIIPKLIVEDRYLGRQHRGDKYKYTNDIYYYCQVEGQDCYLHRALKRGYQTLSCAILELTKYEYTRMLGSDAPSLYPFGTLVVHDGNGDNAFTLSYLHNLERVLLLYKTWISQVIEYNLRINEQPNEYDLRRYHYYLNIKNNEGKTALHIALDLKYPWAEVEALLSFYADSNLKDITGKSAVDRALESIDEELKTHTEIFGDLIKSKKGMDVSEIGTVSKYLKLQETTTMLFMKIENDLAAGDLDLGKAISMLVPISAILNGVKTGRLEKNELEASITKLKSFMTSWDWRLLIGCFIGAVVGVTMATAAIGIALPQGLMALKYGAIVLSSIGVGAGIGLWRTKENDLLRQFALDADSILTSKF